MILKYEKKVKFLSAGATLIKKLDSTDGCVVIPVLEYTNQTILANKLMKRKFKYEMLCIKHLACMGGGVS